MKLRPRPPHLEAQHAGPMVVLFGAGDREFSCALPDWNFIVELGQTFGWQPAGTTYLPQQGQRARLNPIKHDYQPGDSQDRKRVEAHDSEHWSVALAGAKRSPFISAMLRKHSQLQAGSGTSTEASMHSQLQSFIELARRGAFTIALQS
ncbi:hypothetical protein [Steroidobacter sp.]|uniref:hypothetical protein n=1 Tax=Steroidobacter sp. TaxID=1978227 RepID=UPI001A405333|nr:hypothetical protein [Steroidobacter sp.]MBL8265689.1 hypothetical protein [Steroidobacter sp.]